MTMAQMHTELTWVSIDSNGCAEVRKKRTRSDTGVPELISD